MTNTVSPERLVITDPRARVLWDRLQQFSFDRGSGPHTFTARLAHEQNWSEPFAALAIAEYRRYLLLSALATSRGQAVPGAPPAVCIVPPPMVDKVWHLHLLYTQSYWEDLCRDVLGGPLHHLPADGASGEAPALGAVYRDTLEAYRRTFGHPAPELIWPPADPVTVSAATRAPSKRLRAVVIAGAIGSLLLVATLARGQTASAAFFLFAVVACMVGLGRPRRRRAGGSSWTFGGDDAGSDFFSSDSSAHHHGGGHDTGGHSSHSCGGGHSCGGHGCGGHGCGGGH